MAIKRGPARRTMLRDGYARPVMRSNSSTKIRVLVESSLCNERTRAWYFSSVFRSLVCSASNFRSRESFMLFLPPEEDLGYGLELTAFPVRAVFVQTATGSVRVSAEHLLQISLDLLKGVVGLFGESFEPVLRPRVPGLVMDLLEHASEFP